MSLFGKHMESFVSGKKMINSSQLWSGLVWIRKVDTVTPAFVAVSDLRGRRWTDQSQSIRKPCL